MSEPFADLTDEQLEALYRETVVEAQVVTAKGGDIWPTAVRLGEIVYVKRNRERRANTHDRI